MRNPFKLLTLISLISLMIFWIPAEAQQRKSRVLTAKESKTKRSSVKHTVIPKSNVQKQNPAGQLKNATDTLNFPLEGDYSLYVYEGGYYAGNNDYWDLAKANYFASTQEYLITGILIDFGYVSGSNADIEIAVWSTSKSPGSKIGSQTIPLLQTRNLSIATATNYPNFCDCIGQISFK